MRASSEWPVTVMCEVNYIEYVVVIVGQFTVVTSLLPFPFYMGCSVCFRLLIRVFNFVDGHCIDIYNTSTGQMYKD